MKLQWDTQYIRKIELKAEEAHRQDRFPFTLPIIRNLKEITFDSSVTYIVGENGMGKSTLLEGIAVAYGFNPEGGTTNFNFSNYDSHSDLHHFLRLVKGAYRPSDNFFFRAETFYNLATNIDEIDAVHSYGGKSLHEMSHGESFFAAFNERFQGNGLYILDEPEAALSPLRQMSLLARMDDLVHEGSQFIISTHSPIIMAYPGAKIIQITDEGMEETTLENTSHYSIMKQFFEDRGRFLRHLLR
ncbi:AAA family ATPase [Bacillus sp. FJAT-27225]|uniref:AAA family ATPase n=1 Tax=Bacillus sp. FJAT-27225 TaxID=1743144 RepID=UPI00080C355B|nr:AAA family ATPase [Bacillus sp. FJAT-27225]OCA85750.1 AAA family ATPase [Bacillus sp. FJAT-27225]